MTIRPFALAVLGCLSGLLSITVGGPLGLGLLAPGVFFGVLLAAFLWISQGIEAPFRLAILIAVSAASFFLAVLAVTFLPVPELFERLGSMHGPGPTRFLAAGVLGGSIVSTAYLAVLPTAPSVSRLLSEMIFCGAAAGMLGLVGGIAGDRFTPPLPMNTGLVTIWQGGMAFVLALVAELRTALSPERDGAVADEPGALPTGAPPMTLAARAFLSLCVAALIAGVFLESRRQVEGKASLAKWEAEQAASRAEAPSRENLPGMTRQPPGSLLILEEIAAMSVAGSTGSVKPAEQYPPTSDLAAAPERAEYVVSYTGLFGDATVILEHYPSAEWARYRTRIFFYHEPYTLDGHHLLRSGDEYAWYSGDKIVRILEAPDGQAVLRAYLQRYPSSIPESSPLLKQKRAD